MSYRGFVGPLDGAHVARFLGLYAGSHVSPAQFVHTVAAVFRVDLYVHRTIPDETTIETVPLVIHWASRKHARVVPPRRGSCAVELEY